MGPACQDIQVIEGNHHIHGQTNIAFNHLDPGGNLKKIKQPKTIIQPQRKRFKFQKGSKKMLLHQRANQYACQGLSMKQVAKFTFTQSKHGTQKKYIYIPAKGKYRWNKQHLGTR